MSFRKYDIDGNVIRNAVKVDCSDDDVLVEQSHKEKVDINTIIARHGIDLIQKTAMLQSSEYQFDDVTGNDFQEAMFKINKAQESFDSMPSKLRQRFNNNPAEFLDFVQNENNLDEMLAMGLVQRKPEPEPVQVMVTNPETPPAPAEAG